MEYVIGAIVVIALVAFFSSLKKSNNTINNHNPYDFDPRDND